jgi:hypothetical protein
MRLRAKTSSREQGPNFNLVGTCVWRVGQVLSPVGCINSGRRDTLGSE